jgi:type IV pilus assembly protein PilM
MELMNKKSSVSGLSQQISSSPKGVLQSLWAAFKKSTFIWGPQLNDIGLSVGHRNIVAVEIDKTGDFPRLVKCGVREVSTDNPNVSALLREMFDTEHFSNSYVNTSISGKSIIIRFIRFPKMQKKELRTSLEFEAEKYIPFAVNQVYMDFDIIGSDDNSKFIDVALVAAKREGVDDVLQMCKNAGLTPRIIDVDSFACMNTFLTAYPEEVGKTVALVNIGAKITNVIVMDKGTPAFSRDVYFGGDDITGSLSKKLHIDLQAAAKIKYNLKKEKDENIALIIREILGYLMTELKLSFDYFENQEQKKKSKIEAVYLIGGTSRLEGIDGILSQGLGTSVQILDPLRCVTVDPSIDQNLLNTYSASLAVPIGLALRS